MVERSLDVCKLEMEIFFAANTIYDRLSTHVTIDPLAIVTPLCLYDLECPFIDYLLTLIIP